MVMPDDLSAAAPQAGAGAPLITVVVSLAVLGWVLYRQLQIRDVKASFLLPGVLMVLGVAALFFGKGRLTSPAEFGILAGVLVGDAVCLGAIRAWTVRVWQEGDRYLRQGTWLTVGLWVVGVAIHETVDIVEHIPEASVIVYLGVTWIAQQLVLLGRVRRFRREQEAARPAAMR
jgi:hypothetical protein